MKTLKIGKNKGLARIWLERKILSENGWRKGQRFAVHVFNEEILLTVDSLHNMPSDPPSRHRVSGSDERPVIDLNGQWLQDFFDRFAVGNLWVPTHYTVYPAKLADGMFIITPVLTTIDNQPFLPVTKRRPQSMRRFDDVFETQKESDCECGLDESGNWKGSVFDRYGCGCPVVKGGAS